MPLQLEVIDEFAGLVRGVLDCVGLLRQRGVAIGATTGYFCAAAERVYHAAALQGYRPDCCVCAEEVPAGRPAPWMIFRIMEALDRFPPASVVKVGDTPPDIGEGLAAGAWSVGVLRGSSEVGCTEAEWDALARAEQVRRLALSGEAPGRGALRRCGNAGGVAGLAGRHRPAARPRRETVSRLDGNAMQPTWDLIVIGAGILGTAHAYYAARRGWRVLLLERGDWPGAASVRNFGTLMAGSLVGEWRRRGLESIAFYRELRLWPASTSSPVDRSTTSPRPPRPPLCGNSPSWLPMMVAVVNCWSRAGPPG